MNGLITHPPVMLGVAHPSILIQFRVMDASSPQQPTGTPNTGERIEIIDNK